MSDRQMAPGQMPPAQQENGPQLALHPMRVAEERVDQIVYQEVGVTGTTVTVAAPQPTIRHDEVRTADGRRVCHTETRSTMTPTISGPVSVGRSSVREEQLQPTVTTRAYETFRRDPATVFPDAKVINVSRMGPVVTPSGCVLDPQTNTVYAAGFNPNNYRSPANQITIQPTANHDVQVDPVYLNQSQAVSQAMSQAVSQAPSQASTQPTVTGGVAGGPVTGQVFAAQEQQYAQQQYAQQQYTQQQYTQQQYAQPQYVQMQPQGQQPQGQQPQYQYQQPQQYQQQQPQQYVQYQQHQPQEMEYQQREEEEGENEGEGEGEGGERSDKHKRKSSSKHGKKERDGDERKSSRKTSSRSHGQSEHNSQGAPIQGAPSQGAPIQGAPMGYPQGTQYQQTTTYTQLPTQVYHYPPVVTYSQQPQTQTQTTIRKVSQKGGTTVTETVTYYGTQTEGRPMAQGDSQLPPDSY